MKRVFNPKELIFSLDIGTRSIIGTVGILKDKKFEVICEKYKEHEERAMVDGQIHDINLVAIGVKKIKDELESELNCKLKEVSIAAAGRFLKTCDSKYEIELNGDEEIDQEIVRTLELGSVKAAEEEVNKGTDGKLYCVGYSVKNYYLNSYIISNLIGHKGEKIAAEVIATFLPRSVVDSLYTVMNKVELKVRNLTLEPIAAIEAAVPQKLRLLNIALVDIGAGTSDIAISSKETISAYAMVPMAGDEVTEVIAQEYLVDFNTAEVIKRKIDKEEEITYVDAIGFENTVKSEAVKKLIAPTVAKIAEAIASKIKEINGGKSPSAVFLVGGGAHTSGILENIASNLDLPMQRIAIKDRQAIEDSVSSNELGSAGVTVIGIALKAIRSMGTDFIDVYLNDAPVSLFNSHKHTVMDVLIHAGINSSLLIPKNGKTLRFTLNGKKRLVFGELGKGATITINKKIADLESSVQEGDNIEVSYAQAGKEAVAKVIDQVKDINSIEIYLDNKLINVEPVVFVNGKEENIDYIIKDGDAVEVILPKNILELKKYIIKKDVAFYRDNIELPEDYIIKAGESFTLKSTIEDNEEKVLKVKKDAVEGKKLKEISFTINGEKYTLKDKEDYIFLDIFNLIDVNVKESNGNIKLLLNGEKATFTEELKDGDVIEIIY